jgi:hypothetical protein
MNKIIFWNTEHLSVQAAEIAEEALEAAERKLEVKNRHAKLHAKDEPTRRTTRHSIKDIWSAGDRHERAAARAHETHDKAQKRAARARNKLLLSQDLIASHQPQHTFFCEVLSDHTDAQSPLRGGAAAGGGTLCYAHYYSGTSANFTHCAINNAWYVGPAVPPTVERIPRGLVINVARGVHAGQAVRFCFWHAPSGNNGQIVAQMANGLAAAGQPFVLFGDLNAQPTDYNALLAPGVTILDPECPTRISGRTLDYAITNVPGAFRDNRCRPLYPGNENYAIKQRTGSDHMVMVFELK